MCRALGLLAAALLTVSGCGFDDSLTKRGFLVEGDEVCAGTLVRATVEVDAARAQGNALAQDAAIRKLADGYRGAAAGLGELEVIDEDRPMRDKMVAGFERTGTELADAASAGAGAQAAATNALVELRPLASEIRAYGFDQCGGREPA